MSKEELLSNNNILPDSPEISLAPSASNTNTSSVGTVEQKATWSPEQLPTAGETKNPFSLLPEEHLSAIDAALSTEEGLKILGELEPPLEQGEETTVADTASASEPDIETPPLKDTSVFFHPVADIESIIDQVDENSDILNGLRDYPNVTSYEPIKTPESGTETTLDKKSAGNLRKIRRSTRIQDLETREQAEKIRQENLLLMQQEEMDSPSRKYSMRAKRPKRDFSEFITDFGRKKKTDSDTIVDSNADASSSKEDTESISDSTKEVDMSDNVAENDDDSSSTSKKKKPKVVKGGKGKVSAKVAKTGKPGDKKKDEDDEESTKPAKKAKKSLPKKKGKQMKQDPEVSDSEEKNEDEDILDGEDDKNEEGKPMKKAAGKKPAQRKGWKGWVEISESSDTEAEDSEKLQENVMDDENEEDTPRRRTRASLKPAQPSPLVKTSKEEEPESLESKDTKMESTDDDELNEKMNKQALSSTESSDETINPNKKSKPPSFAVIKNFFQKIKQKSDSKEEVNEDVEKTTSAMKSHKSNEDGKNEGGQELNEKGKVKSDKHRRIRGGHTKKGKRVLSKYDKDDDYKESANSAEESSEDDVSDDDGDDSDTSLVSDGSWKSEDDPERLWCICKKPYNNRFMICCDKCEDWYHGSCVGITKQEGARIAKEKLDWSCPPCIDGTKKKDRVAASNSDNMKSSPAKMKSDEKKKKPKKGASSEGKPVSAAKEDVESDTSSIKQVDALSDAGSSRSSSSKIEVGKPKKKIKGERKVHNRCIAKDCFNNSKSGSVYCSDACIAKYAKDSIQILQEEKLKLRGKSDEKHTKIAPSMSDRIIVFDRRKSKLISGPLAPTANNLQTFLVNHPSFEVVQPGMSTSNFKDQVKIKERQQKEKLVNADRKEKEEKRREREEKRRKEEKRKKEEADKINAVIQKAKEAKQALEAPNPIRIDVRKTIKESLDERADSADDIILTGSEIKAVALAVEEELFKFYGKVGSRYKNRFTSLISTIKDKNNQGFFRRILNGKLKPYKVVRLDSEAMASKDLAKWRFPSPKRILQSSEKGETNHGKDADISKITTENKDKRDGEGKVDNTEDKPNEEKKSFDILGSIILDTTSQHGKHIFDLNCKICNGREAKERAKKEDELRKVQEEANVHNKEENVDVMSSQRTDRSKDRKSIAEKKEPVEARFRSYHQKDPRLANTERREPVTSSSAPTKSGRRTLLPDPVPGRPVPKNILNDPRKTLTETKDPRKTLTETKDPRIKDPRLLDPRLRNTSSIKPGDGASKAPTTVPPSASKIVTPADSTIDLVDLARRAAEARKAIEQKNSKMHAWKGFVNMQEVSTFETMAYRISGPIDKLSEYLPETINITGRISPEQVWAYIFRIKSSKSREITLVRLQAAKHDDKPLYIKLYSYLHTRGRCGVVGHSSKDTDLKDVYLFPLPSSMEVPKCLLPFDGPGFGAHRPHMLLGIIVRAKSKEAPSNNMEETIAKTLGEVDGLETGVEEELGEEEDKIVRRFGKPEPKYKPIEQPKVLQSNVTESENPEVDEEDKPYDPFEDEDDVPDTIVKNEREEVSDILEKFSANLPEEKQAAVAATLATAASSDINKQKALLSALERKVEEQKRVIEERQEKLKQNSIISSDPLQATSSTPTGSNTAASATTLLASLNNLLSTLKPNSAQTCESPRQLPQSPTSQTLEHHQSLQPESTSTPTSMSSITSGVENSKPSSLHPADIPMPFTSVDVPQKISAEPKPVPAPTDLTSIPLPGQTTGLTAATSTSTLSSSYGYPPTLAYNPTEHLPPAQFSKGYDPLEKTVTSENSYGYNPSQTQPLTYNPAKPVKTRTVEDKNSSLEYDPTNPTATYDYMDEAKKETMDKKQEASGEQTSPSVSIPSMTNLANVASSSNESLGTSEPHLPQDLIASLARKRQEKKQKEEIDNEMSVNDKASSSTEESSPGHSNQSKVTGFISNSFKPVVLGQKNVRKPQMVIKAPLTLPTKNDEQSSMQSEVPNNSESSPAATKEVTQQKSNDLSLVSGSPTMVSSKTSVSSQQSKSKSRERSVTPPSRSHRSRSRERRRRSRSNSRSRSSHKRYRSRSPSKHHSRRSRSRSPRSKRYNRSRSRDRDRRRHSRYNRDNDRQTPRGGRDIHRGDKERGSRWETDWSRSDTAHERRRDDNDRRRLDEKRVEHIATGRGSDSDSLVMRKTAPDISKWKAMKAEVLVEEGISDDENKKDRDNLNKNTGLSNKSHEVNKYDTDERNISSDKISSFLANLSNDGNIDVKSETKNQKSVDDLLADIARKPLPLPLSQPKSDMASLHDQDERKSKTVSLDDLLASISSRPLPAPAKPVADESVAQNILASLSNKPIDLQSVPNIDDSSKPALPDLSAFGISVGDRGITESQSLIGKSGEHDVDLRSDYPSSAGDVDHRVRGMHPSIQVRESGYLDDPGAYSNYHGHERDVDYRYNEYAEPYPEWSDEGPPAKHARIDPERQWNIMDHSRAHDDDHYWNATYEYEERARDYPSERGVFRGGRPPYPSRGRANFRGHLPFRGGPPPIRGGPPGLRGVPPPRGPPRGMVPLRRPPRGPPNWRGPRPFRPR